MTTTEIVSSFGAYYLQQGQSIASLYQKLLRAFVTHSIFTPIVTESELWRASESMHSRIVQPFQKAFTPTGSVTFKPVEIRQYRQKADLSETPDDLVSTWLGFLANIDEPERKNWPFIRWWIEVHIIPQIQQDIELNEIGRGVFAAPTPGTAGAAGTSMNGIQKIIADHITGGRITPFALGTIPADDADFVTYLEDFHKNINKAYWHIPMQVCMSEDLVLRYKRGYGEKYGTRNNFDEAPDGTVKVKFTNLTLAGLPSMNLQADGSASSRIFATPKSNAVMLSKGFSNSNGKFDVQAFERVVKLLTDWYMGVGFIIPEIVFTNDQA